MSKVSNPDDAQDILQDSLAKAVARLHTLKDSAKLTSWLYAIVRASIIDFYRKKKPVHDLEDVLLFEKEEHPQARDENDNREMAKCVMGLLAGLSKSDRDIIEAIEFRNVNQAALARRRGLSISGAKSKIQRARKKLKAMLHKCCQIKTDSRGNVIHYQQKNQKACCESGCTGS